MRSGIRSSARRMQRPFVIGPFLILRARERRALRRSSGYKDIVKSTKCGLCLGAPSTQCTISFAFFCGFFFLVAIFHVFPPVTSTRRRGFKYMTFPHAHSDETRARW